MIIVPSWEDVSAEDADKAKFILHMDPGTAFGTGMHETTQLCIRTLRKYTQKGQRLLDVGCGSGILSILFLMFGGEKAFGLDLDPCAIEACGQNMERNNVNKADFQTEIGNIITDEALRERILSGEYDIITANILAEVLVLLTPIVSKCLKSDGVYIASGILTEKADIVKAAMEQAGLTVINEEAQGEWVGITARK